MHVMSIAFATLSVGGTWRPINWKSKPKKIFYKFYSFALIFLIHLFAMAQLVMMSVGDVNQEVYMQVLYMSFSVVIDLCRALNHVFNRNNIIELANMLKMDYCLAKNAKEIEVQKRHDAEIRRVTIIINSFMLVTWASFHVMPLLSHEIPTDIWLPYELDCSWKFWLTFLGEAISYMCLSIINANDCSIVSGFMLQSCAQLEILSLRVDEMIQIVKRALDHDKTSPNLIQMFQRQTLGKIVRHHLYIHTYTKKIIKTFTFTTIVQVVMISLIITFSIFKLLKMKIPSVEFVSVIAYFVTMTVGFFIVCWFGNQVTLKNLEFGDNIYKKEWIFLSQESKKKLLFIIHQSSKPLIICCGHYIVLDLSSFKSILKFSYTAFNFLREFE